MFSRSSWLHLRIPFSFFLLPIFLFAVCVSPAPDWSRTCWVFLILHLFLYPASNGYNSYFDKDEESIGGLKHPPPVTSGLYYLALSFDAIAIVLSYIKINTTFAAMALLYGLVSKAYSHPAVRLKKRPWTSWIITGIFQGLFTFFMTYIGVNDYPLADATAGKVLVPGLLTSAMLWANYPLTQIYQHAEDLKRGDITLSARLGIVGTFYFSASVFALALVGFVFYLKATFGVQYAVIFFLAVLPLVTYFGYWFLQTRRNLQYADHSHTMRLNLISGVCLNAFFIYLFLGTTTLPHS